MPDPIKRSEVEHIKENSRYLRGTLAQSLENRVTGALYPDDTHLIKFHGAYQQTDRDLDTERKRQKLEPLYSLMIRVRVPGGVASPAQWLRLTELAELYGNGTLKITTRQAIQLHGVQKRQLKAAVQGFTEVAMDSIAGCGDVNRNVMASPNPHESRAHADLYAVAAEISRVFTPQTTAYTEVWLDGKRLDDATTENEPLYGPTYLPRKFKIALAIPPQNDTDVLANDVGLIAVVDPETGTVRGFNVAAGGGMGMTFGMPNTFPRLADVLGYVDRENTLKVCAAILTTQRDHGNRADRKFSRLKYTIERLGLEAFKREVEQRAGVAFEPAAPYRFEHTGDRYGWATGADGRLHLTLFIEGGRVADRPGYKLKTALRAVAALHRDGEFRLTGNQNIVIANVPPARRVVIEAILQRHGVLQKTFEHTALRLNSIACVALNTCSLAFAEAERYLPTLLDRLDAVIRAQGLARDAITIRMTGCPNGCGRPYLAEIGFVGKAVGRYNLYLGAAHDGTRLNKLYREMLDEDAIIETLTPLLAAYARERLAGERFGDFVLRTGVVRATTHGTDFHN
jgi:sulfite reductase (NADPH) hemoprotein beta-component